MNVWSYGGSYIIKKIDSFPDQYKNQWIQIVSRELGATHHCQALEGSSIDWIYKTFFDTKDNIQEGDVVIISLPDILRRWLLEDYPDKTYIRQSPTNNAEENKAFKYYTLYLDNPIPHRYYLLNFLYMLNEITKNLNLHTIVMVYCLEVESLINDHSKDFTNLNVAKGTLLSISYNEYDEEMRKKKEILQGERLINHMLISNHIILASKVLDNIKNKNPIDLNIGFKRNMITKDTFTNKEFYEKENFGNPLNSIYT